MTFPGLGFWRSCFLGACETFETADGELRFSHFADGGRGPLKIVLHTACWRSSSNTNLRLHPTKIRVDRDHRKKPNQSTPVPREQRSATLQHMKPCRVLLLVVLTPCSHPQHP